MHDELMILTLFLAIVLALTGLALAITLVFEFRDPYSRFRDITYEGDLFEEGQQFREDEGPRTR
jgi:hypothetical protein